MGVLSSSEIETTGSTLGGQLEKLLTAKDIEPGADPSYELEKILYLYHPLGKKMVDSPIMMAQSQARKITVQEAPKEVIKAFEKEWKKLDATKHIRNVRRLARIYGIASLAIGIKGEKDTKKPLEMNDLWNKEIWFNEWDPLNTAGSLVLSQIPTAPDFNKPNHVSVNGQEYHLTRARVVMNEEPIYLAFTTGAFGFVGRSVYQRALYPMKSYVLSMKANDMVQTKLGLLITKQESPGSIVSEQMGLFAALKAALLKRAKTGQVLTVGVNDAVETLNMQNVDGAGGYSRTNILKDIATAAEMPAIMLENETLAAGFADGTEDAKIVARYIEGMRADMEPEYSWFDNIVMHRAWSPQFYKSIIQVKYPAFRRRPFADAFSEWREAFSAEWPSLLIEPESERVKVQDVQLQAIVAVLQTLLPQVDPANKVRLIEWARDNIAENTLLFAHEMDLDPADLEDYFEEQEEQQLALAAEGKEGGTEEVGPEARKMGRFDSVTSTAVVDASLQKLSAAVERLADRRARRAAGHG